MTRPYDTATFNTRRGWVGTVAQPMADLPVGAVLVVESGDGYRILVVTVAVGGDARHPDFLFVRDVDRDHVWVPEGASGSYADEGFYAFDDDTLFFRVVETDSPELAELVVAGDGRSVLAEVLVDGR